MAKLTVLWYDKKPTSLQSNGMAAIPKRLQIHQRLPDNSIKVNGMLRHTLRGGLIFYFCCILFSPLAFKPEVATAAIRAKCAALCHYCISFFVNQSINSLVTLNQRGNQKLHHPACLPSGLFHPSPSYTLRLTLCYRSFYTTKLNAFKMNDLTIQLFLIAHTLGKELSPKSFN